MEALWHEIFKSVHLYEEDPVAYWKKKDHDLSERSDRLNDYAFKEPTILPLEQTYVSAYLEGHLWSGAGSLTLRAIALSLICQPKKSSGPPMQTKWKAL